MVATGKREPVTEKPEADNNHDPLEGHTMINFIKNFRNDEDGAVTVDWVVLTAAVVGLAIAAYSSIQTGTSDLTSGIATFMSSQDPS